MRCTSSPTNGWLRMALLLNGDIALAELFAEPVRFLRPRPFERNADRLRERRRYLNDE